MIEQDDVHPKAYKAALAGQLLPLFIVLPFFLLAAYGRGHLRSDSPIELWLLFGAGLISISIGILNTSSCAVFLYPDRIEKRTWFGRKTILRSDLGEIRKRGHGLIILSYKHNRADGIVIPKGIAVDAEWRAWMSDLKGADIFDR